MKYPKLFSSLALVLAAMIWGVSFTAQRSAMETLPPLVFSTLRSVLGALALIPVIALSDKCCGRKISLWGSAASDRERRTLLSGGILCGIMLAAGMVTQQYGLKYISAGKTGFLTSLYIILVPILGMVFFRRKTGWLLWLSGGIALTGANLLCSGTPDSFGTGEIFVLICAVFFALHVLVSDIFAPQADCIRLSFIQFVTVSILTAVTAICAGEPWIVKHFIAAKWQILYCGIFSSGAGFTLQMAGQKHLHPTTTALLISLESVFAALAGYLILGEHLSLAEITGCTVIFSAVILSQLPTKKK